MLLLGGSPEDLSPIAHRDNHFLLAFSMTHTLLTFSFPFPSLLESSSKQITCTQYLISSSLFEWTQTRTLPRSLQFNKLYSAIISILGNVLRFKDKQCNSAFLSQTVGAFFDGATQTDTSSQCNTVIACPKVYSSSKEGTTNSLCSGGRGRRNLFGNTSRKGV